jgi:PTS system nitrogen regulatory IIA component
MIIAASFSHKSTMLTVNRLYLSIDKHERQNDTLIMTLLELTKPELILINAPCASKDNLIITLIEQIYSAGFKPPVLQDDLLQTILKREQIGGTLLPSGLSVPHARIGGFDGFILTFGMSKEPLFHEGTQIRLMALMVSSQSGGLFYLPTVAALTKISRDAAFLSNLCKAENAEEFISLLKEKDQLLM